MKLKKRVLNGMEVYESSGNVFADIGLPNPEKLLLKVQLTFEIEKAIRKLRLTKVQACERMDISPDKFSLMIRGHFPRISEHKLMQCLNRLGYDIVMTIKRTRKAKGFLRLAD